MRDSDTHGKTLEGALGGFPVAVDISRPVRQGEWYKKGKAVGLKRKFGRTMVQVTYPVYAGRGISGAKQLFDWIDLEYVHDSGPDGPEERSQPPS